MSLRQIVHIQAAPGKGREIVDQAVLVATQIRQEPGCLQWDVFQSAEDPDKVVVIEMWTDVVAFQAHAAVPPPKPPPEVLALYSPQPMIREDYEYVSVPVYWPHDRPETSD